MFDIGWSELLIFVVVALIFLGRDELPAFLRTMGRWSGMLRRQADEFRSYVDEAMRQAELDALQKDIEKVGQDVEAGVRSAQTATAGIEPDAKAAGNAPLSIDSEMSTPVSETSKGKADR